METLGFLQLKLNFVLLWYINKDYMRLKITFVLFFCLLQLVSIQAQKEFCKTTDSLGARTSFVQAKMLYRQGKLDDAVSFFKKARQVYGQIGCKESVFLMNRNILKVHVTTGNVIAFDSLFSRVMAEVDGPKTKEDATFKGRVLQLKSKMYLNQKQLDSAIVYGRKAKAIHEKYGIWKYYIRANNHLAIIAYYQHDLDGMERYIDNSFSAYKLYLKTKRKALQEIMRLYGSLYYKTGEYEKALEKTTYALEVALSDLKSRDDTIFVQRCYNNIGLFYIKIGDIYKAEDYCHNALRLSQKLGRHFETATIYLNLGEFFYSQEKLEEALDYYKKGITALDKAKNIPPHELDKSAISLYNGIGAVATKLGRNLEALEALKRSLKIHQREESKKDETFTVLGFHYKTIGTYNKAIEYYQKAIKLRKGLYGSNHPLVAEVYYKLGQTEQKKNNNSQANVYYDLAELALQVSLSDSLQLLSKKTEEEEQVSDKEVLLKILYAKASLLVKNKELLEAYKMTQRAVLILEKMRNGFKEEGSKLFMLQKMIPTYELSIGLAFDLYQKTKNKDYIRDAFQLVEKSKAMLLLDALKTEEARNFGNVPKELLVEERRLARERVRYEKLLFEAKADNDAAKISIQQKGLLNLKRASEKLETTLEQEYPKYHELKYNTQIASLEEVQESFDEKIALIEFFVGNDNIYIFSVYKDTAWMTSVPMNSDFTASIKGLRVALTDINLLTKDKKSSYLLLAKNARSLYQKYLEPALKKEGIERIVLIPDGLLNYVPFDVLLTEKPNYKEVDFKKLPYLVKDYNINYHYSSTLMLFSRKTAKTNGKILAMASSYNKNRFRNMKGLAPRHLKIRTSVSDLPGAKREVEFLARTFAGKYLYGPDANEESFKYFTQKNHYSIIHLAMHGVVDAKEPEYSSLVFSYINNEAEDDLVHAYELNLLEINTDLVVLSACETGFGKYERGEGVVSLGRGFMYAGAPALVMTLWPINDKATSILISEFYQQLSSGYGKDEAMRIAKLTYLNKSNALTSHPFFWASFVNFGDYQHITLSKHWFWWHYVLAALPLLLVLIYAFRKKNSRAT
jgi:CHAT domain-containing protein/tetratricopeptide (TPR) repeat protein